MKEKTTVEKLNYGMTNHFRSIKANAGLSESAIDKIDIDENTIKTAAAIRELCLGKSDAEKRIAGSIIGVNLLKEEEELEERLE